MITKFVKYHLLVFFFIFQINVIAQDNILKTSDPLINAIQKIEVKSQKDIDKNTFFERTLIKLSLGLSFNRHDILQPQIDNYAYYSKYGRVFHTDIDFVLSSYFKLGLNYEYHEFNLVQRLENLNTNINTFETKLTLNLLPTELMILTGFKDTNYLYLSSGKFTLLEVYSYFIGTKIRISFDILFGNRFSPYLKFRYLLKTNDLMSVEGEQYIIGADIFLINRFGITVSDEYTNLKVGNKIQRENSFKTLIYYQL